MTTAKGDVAIRVEGLGKKYSLGKRERDVSLRDSIVGADDVAVNACARIATVRATSDAERCTREGVR